MKMKVRNLSLAALILTLALAVCSPVVLAADGTIPGKITVDGKADDWDDAKIVSVTTGNIGDVKVTSVRAAVDENGTLYLLIEGVGNEWVGWKWMYITFEMTGPNPWNDSETMLFSQPISINDLSDMPDAQCKYASDANGNSEAPFVIELAIPKIKGYNTTFDATNPSFRFTAGDTAFPGNSIPVIDGQEIEVSKEPAVYNGITVDGQFSDWDAVIKRDVSGQDSLSEAAMIFDGDMVYIYLREKPGHTAALAGSGNNGKYAITTDLGYQLVFNLNQDGSVTGVNGAQSNYVGRQWEIAIPASQLPFYKDTVSFGLYLDNQQMIPNVGNLDGSSGTAPEFNGIAIDGQCGDWSGYPHATIEYATPGTQETVADSTGAIYFDGNKIFAHASTSMPAHLYNQGGDFMAAVKIAFNGELDSENGGFYPKIVAVDESGNITVLNENTRLNNGTYHFYIHEIRDGRDILTDAASVANNAFGEMYVVIGDDKQEMEFYLDVDKVSDYTRIGPGDIKEVSAQFGRLGNGWLTQSGASTGPWLGLALAVGIVAGVFLYRRRKGVCFG